MRFDLYNIQLFLTFAHLLIDYKYFVIFDSEMTNEIYSCHNGVGWNWQVQNCQTYFFKNENHCLLYFDSVFFMSFMTKYLWRLSIWFNRNVAFQILYAVGKSTIIAILRSNTTYPDIISKCKNMIFLVVIDLSTWRLFVIPSSCSEIFFIYFVQLGRPLTWRNK